jgi:predicted AlkP superfamily phosphohydrolase/phosphomutase
MQRKVYLIGLDGMIYPMYRRFVQEGILPNLEQLSGNVINTEVYSSLPAHNPMNWATMITGAHSETHFIIRWYVDLPGPKNTEKSINFLVGWPAKAETIFEAAAQAGLKSVAFHYPANAPRRTQNLYAIGGFDNSTYGSTPFEVMPALTYKNLIDIPRTCQVKLIPGNNWANLPPSHQTHLEFPILMVTKQEGKNRCLYGLVLDNNGSGYDTVIACTNKDGNPRITTTLKGTWSTWCRENFVITGRPQKGTFRFKTVELSPNAKRLRLYHSQIVMIDEFYEPREPGSELVEKFGPYQEHDSLAANIWGATDFETYLQEMKYQAQWIARASNYIMNTKNCHLFYCHIHIFDHMNHRHLSGVEPMSPEYNSSSTHEHWKVYRHAYMLADRMIDTFLEGIDNNTNVIVASDHVAVSDRRAINMRKFLYKKAFLSLIGSSRWLNNDETPDKNIDWKKTKVFMKPGRGYDIFININAKEGSNEYLRIQDELVHILCTWVDDDTGQCPIAVALRKKDAPLLGFWGDQCGNVVFINEDGYVHSYMSEWHLILGHHSLGEPLWYGAHHGTQLPISRTEIASDMAFLLTSGPGIKKRYEQPVNELGDIHMTSLIPLICHLLGIETAAQCQGYLPSDILESGPCTIERRVDYPNWEPGTRPEIWGEHIQIQKDMFDFVSKNKKWVKIENTPHYSTVKYFSKLVS